MGHGGRLLQRKLVHIRMVFTYLDAADLPANHNPGGVKTIIGVHDHTKYCYETTDPAALRAAKDDYIHWSYGTYLNNCAGIFGGVDPKYLPHTAGTLTRYIIPGTYDNTGRKM